MKNILSSLNEYEKKRILEMHYRASQRQYLAENPTGTTPTTTTQTTTPGDPSQSTIDLSTEYSALKSALDTYNSEYESITGNNPGLFLRSSNKVPTNLLITSNERQQLGGDGYILKYEIPKGNLYRYFAATKTSAQQLLLYPKIDGRLIGDGPQGIWSYGGVNREKEKQVAKVKAAAATAGQAIANFFNAFTTKNVPSNYVITRLQGFGDGSSEFVLGPPKA